MSKPKLRAHQAALSFTEKVKILEKLRDREKAIAVAGLRRREHLPIKLVAGIEPEYIHELDEESGYFSHRGDGRYSHRVARLCKRSSIPYSPRFVSIAVLSEGDDESAVQPFGEPVLLNIDAVLRLLKLICSDDIQNVADNNRGKEVLLKDLSELPDQEKIRVLQEAVAKRSNAAYAEARIYEALKREHTKPGWSNREKDPFSKLGLLE
jgi:hypothetical protein